MFPTSSRPDRRGAGDGPTDRDIEAKTAEVETEADEPGAASEIERREAGVSTLQHGQRFDHVLVALAGEFSRRHLQGLIADGQARIDGVVVDTPAKKLRAGQQVTVDLVPTAESRAFLPQALPIAVVYEDEHLLVVDKAVGMVVHPAAGNWSGTLLNALLARDPQAATLPRAGIVHRLDKDTSGLMVVGKTLAAVTALVRAIAAREVRRDYRAIAHGSVQPSSFAIDAPVGRDPQTRVRMAIVAGGKPARTDVECVATGAGASALQCRLHSGRTHQIRVHLASRGHPLVGDALYGGRPSLGLTRQALHAARLGFVHPMSGRSVIFESPLPPELAAAWASVIGAGS